ncbi:MAG TPA: DUF3859 domain-containing protein [Mariniphaga anaerophila]|uniref:DUF3859 domain-containing protein n=1 Tax=Mariniphaga anaerophila TaxID=1484053 RepID=A0A831LK43_9BACT|nr:DUF3859 domain-containing protein [Mariniphaga anaerophila]
MPPFKFFSVKIVYYCSFKNKNGKIAPPFEGEQFIRTNDFLFYLGDCVWEPLEDKLGNWELTTYHKGKVVAHKVLSWLRNSYATFFTSAERASKASSAAVNTSAAKSL